MRELLGIPMGTLALVLVITLAATLGVVAVLALRNRVFFRLGVRNLGRRRARTALIVSGLMLGTTIIAAALATGDTMSHTIRSSAITALGEIDELVSTQGAKVDPGLDVAAGTVRAGYFDADTFERVRASVRGSDLVDGVAPAIMEPIAAQAPRTRQSEPRIGLFASDAAHLEGFGPIRARDGGEVSLDDLAPGEAFLTADAADDLAVRTGDVVRLLAGERGASVRVRAIVDYDGTGEDGGAALVGLPAAQRLLGRPGKINHVLVSNRGDAIAGADLSDDVQAALGPALRADALRAETVKRDAIETADDAGAAFLSFFTTFGAFSIFAGILLIFLIFVMLAAERRGELGIARAVGTRRGHLVQMFMFEGVAYGVLAAAVGVLLGIGVAYLMVLMIADAFSGASDLDIGFSITARSMIVAYAIGVLLTFAVVTFSAWRVSRTNIVTAIRNLPEPAVRSHRRRRFVLPLVGLAAGAFMTAGAVDSREGVPFAVGGAIVLFSLVAAARALGVGDRLARSVGGAVLVVWFTLPMGEWLVGDMTTDFSIFIVAGVMIVIGATWLILYNAQVIQRVAARATRHLPGIAPAVKMAMAYPLRSLFRTGVTLAMFTLVVLTLVVGATTSGAFVNAFDDLGTFGGGFDVRATTSPASPVTDLRAALERGRGVDPDDVTAVGSVSVVPVDARQAGTPRGYESYLVRGADQGFLDHTTYGFAAMARGYDSPQDVWRAMREEPGLAVVDALSVPHRANFSFGTFSDFELSGFFVEDQTFDPVPVDLRAPAGGQPVRLKVIGVLADTTPNEMAGLWTSQDSLTRFGDRAVPTMHLVDLRDGVDATATAKALESQFLPVGMEADALDDLLDDAVAASRTFNGLLQGFMALGLIVGVAALGVISARSVVERRQQIGVLRAIGFRRSAVQTSFLVESSLIALTAIVVGTGLGLALAYSVIRDSQDQPSWSNLSFDVPWFNLGIIFVTVYAVGMATTLLPARRAARVYPAEALRYE